MRMKTTTILRKIIVVFIPSNYKIVTASPFKSLAHLYMPSISRCSSCMTFLTSIVVSLTHSQSLFFLGFLVLFLSLPSSMAKFVVEKNSLTVTSSDNIKGTHDRAIWNFRILQYEGSIVGNILYPKDNKKGCKEFDEYGISFKSKPSALPTTVLLDRGSKILLPSNLFMFDFKVPLEVVTPLDVKLLNGSRLVLEGEH
ncbi:Vacuolar-sorting receptor 1 [Glycine soja]